MRFRGRRIPAHAGKTSTRRESRLPFGAHPRSRGENPIRSRTLAAASGSSQLTRGKPGAGLELDLRPRLIPAHAGKTPTWLASSAWTKAHPRSRGENVRMVSPPQALMGSSPLTRGKHFIIQDVPKCGRLIPAHAGKTSRARREPDPRTAHPRSRGENHDLPVDELHFTGSSPLTRGKLHEAVNLGAIRRLIPAHAGKTPDQCSHAARQPAHPRSRGENPRMNLSPGLATGSSPLTRGKPEDELVAGLSDRLIPAHAGKTSTTQNVPLLLRAHPRSRGEN